MKSEPTQPDRPDDPNWDWSSIYTVQTLETFTPLGPILHLKIRRHDENEITAPWQTLQRIKNDILGPDILAIEIYPTDARTINEANYRHLWTLPPTLSLPFGLHPLDRI